VTNVMLLSHPHTVHSTWGRSKSHQTRKSFLQLVQTGLMQVIRFRFLPSLLHRILHLLALKL